MGFIGVYTCTSKNIVALNIDQGASNVYQQSLSESESE